MSGGTVVVGVDMSLGSIRAVEWAVGEAGRRSARLRLVHVVDKADRAVAAAVNDEFAAHAAGRFLLGACAYMASRLGANVPVETAVAPSPPTSALETALVAECGDAEILVVGANGTAGYASTALGSIAARIAAHATCPVVIVAAASLMERPHRIVVGTGPASAGALAFAEHAADAAGAQLVRMDAATPAAAAELVDATRSCDLLVLGSQHSDEPFSSRFGAMAASVVPLALCPVVLVGETDIER